MRRVVIIGLLLLSVPGLAGVRLELEPGETERLVVFQLSADLVPAALYRPPILLCGFEPAPAAEVLEQLARLEAAVLPNRRVLPHPADGVIGEGELGAYAGLHARLILGPGFDGTQPHNPLLEVLEPPRQGWDDLAARDLLAVGYDLRWDPGSLEPTAWNVAVPPSLDAPAGVIVGACLHDEPEVAPTLVFRSPDGGLRRCGVDGEVDVEAGAADGPESLKAAPGVLLELERLSGPATGHRLASDAPFVGVVTVPGRVYLLSGGEEPSIGRLAGVEATAWELPLTAAPREWTALGAGLAVADETCCLYLVEPDGAARRWRWVENRPPGLVATPSGLLVLGRQHWGVLEGEAVDLEPHRLPLPATSSGVLCGARLIYGSKTDLVVVDIIDGDWWSHRLGGSLNLAPVVVGGLVYCAAGDHRLYVFDPTRPAAPLVEVRELDAAPSLLAGLTNLGLLVGTVDGGLRLSNPDVTHRLELDGVPRGPAVRRGEGLLLVEGAGSIVELALRGTPFDPFQPGFREPRSGSRLELEGGVLDGPLTFQPPAHLQATPAQLRQGAVYLVDGAGELWIIAELD